MVEQKSSPRERVVLGFFLLGFALLGVSAVASSRLNVRGTYVPPDPVTAGIILIPAVLTLVAATALSIRYFGGKEGLKLIAREAWPGLLAGGAVGGLVGFFLRALLFGPILLIALVPIYLVSVCVVLWFAQKDAPDKMTGGGAAWLTAAFRDLLPPSRSGADPIARLNELQRRISELPTTHPTQATVLGPGAGAGRELLRVVHDNCGDAVRALQSGVDGAGRPIDRGQIAGGIRRLVSDARGDIGLVATALDPDGVRLFSQLLDELEAVASRLGR